MDYDTIAKTAPQSLTQDRWGEGIAHHPMSRALMRFISTHDSKDYGGHFDWRMGGDGDNGESLMYQMDPFFEWLDTQKPDASYVVNGKVAVVYRPEFGIGWSTQDGNPKRSRFLALNGQVARLVEAKDWPALETLVKSRYPEMYQGSLEDLRIEWLNQGTVFEITERDGCESIRTKGFDLMQAV